MLYSQKLRRVLRKALRVSENVFANECLLSHLIPVVVESLGSAYPELINKQNDILELIAHEQEIFKTLRESSSKAFTEVLSEFPNLEDIDLMECPGFVPAYREFQTLKSNFKNNNIPGDFLYKLTDTYGLTEEHFQKLAQLEEMSYNINDYREVMAEAKQKAKSSFKNHDHSDKPLQSIKEALVDFTRNLPNTENDFKYVYTYDPQEKKYIIPSLKTKVLGILYNDVKVEEVVCNGIHNTRDIVSFVTEASNFYYESGGQQSDQGVLIIKSLSNENLELKVHNVCLINECVVHTCELPTEKANFTIGVGDEVELQVDSNHRKKNICHHTGILKYTLFFSLSLSLNRNKTFFFIKIYYYFLLVITATHLLNGAIRSLFKKVTYQVSSSVTSDNCKLEVGLIGKRITKDDVAKLEGLIK